jgi:peptide/nickel transport system permease protein
MTTSAPLPTAIEVSPSDAPVRRSAVRKLIRIPTAVVCLVFLLFIVFFGLSAPWLAPVGPNVADVNAINAQPFGTHILGTDQNGRDILSRLMWGTQETLLACVIILVVSVTIGVTSGLIAGYYRGRFEAISDFFSDVIIAMPGVVLLIALYTLTGPNIPIAMAVFGVIVSPSFFRLVRGIVVGVRNELYVDAAKVVGLSDGRIVSRHVLWAVRGPVIISSAFILAAGIGIEAGVDFLGLGNPTQPSWGSVLQQSFNNIYNNPVSVVWPALLISLTVLALVLLGNVLTDVLAASTRVKAPSRSKLRSIHDRFGDTEATGGSFPPPGHDVRLAIRGLRIAYPDSAGGVTEVVHGADLDVRKGEIHGLVGESGSGKSQIAFSTLGILPREAVILGGHVVLEGEDLLADDAAMRAARGRRIAYVPQEPMSNLDPSFTIGSQLMRGLRSAKRMPRREAKAQLLALLTRVGIADAERVFRSYPHEISGGMAQRVLICGAVAADPDIIIADEPTTALDVTVQAEVLELLRGLRDERGLAMILVTHNLGVVADICDTVSVMKDGRIVEHQDVDTLFQNPREEYTKQLLASSRRVEIEEAA